MNIENGQYIAGEFLGVRVEDKTNRNTGETWQEYFFGISIPVRKGYAGQTVTIDVKLPKAAIESGEQNGVQEYVGKFALVPVNIMANSYKDKAYVTNYFDKQRKIILPNDLKLAKAV
jgi:hypothetical protein